MSRRLTIKQRMLEGKPVFGTFLKSYCPQIAEIIGYSGMDFVVIDCEHSNYSYSEMEDMVRACEISDMASIVRPPSCTPWHIHHALEIGATGVQIPSIASVQDAADAAVETAFYPEGTRSPNPSLRAAHFGFWQGEKSFFETAKDSSLCVMHVEDIAMVPHVEELCEIPQIDVLFVGPGDLSMSMGKPGKLNDPEVGAVIEDIIRRGLKGGKMMGMLCNSPEAVKKYIDMGVTYVLYSSEVGIMGNALRSLNKNIFDLYR